MSQPQTEHRTDACYWASIDPQRAGLKVLPKRPTTALLTSLGFLAESQVPVAIESLHATFVQGANGQITACLIDREIAQTAREARVDALRPTHCPEELGTEARAFQLLHGEFEPKQAQARRRSRWTAAFIGIVILGMMTSWGLYRRVEVLNTGAFETHDAALARAEEILGNEGNQRLSVESRLTQSLRRLRGTRAPDGASNAPEANVGEQLAHALAQWPTETTAQTQRVTATPDEVVFTVSFADEDDPERLLSTYSSASGWTLSDHKLDREKTRSGSKPRLRFTLQRAEPGAQS
ncbi:MAG: hypothetical protein AAGI53_11720 [Planctomycetota bacterium]